MSGIIDTGSYDEINYPAFAMLGRGDTFILEKANVKEWSLRRARASGICYVFLAKPLSVHILASEGMPLAFACAALDMGNIHCRHSCQHDCEYQHDHY